MRTREKKVIFVNGEEITEYANSIEAQDGILLAIISNPTISFARIETDTSVTITCI